MIKKMLYMSALGIVLVGCQKESVYTPSEDSLMDMVRDWELDARAHGTIVDISGVEFALEELNDGITGVYFPNKVVLNINYWKGSNMNRHTLYHELGHHFGLHHGVTDIMATHNAPSNNLKNKEQYFKLIRLVEEL